MAGYSASSVGSVVFDHSAVNTAFILLFRPEVSIEVESCSIGDSPRTTRWVP